jgi:hypothetical protein
MWNEWNSAADRNQDWIHFLGHPLMGQAVCVKEKSPLLQNVQMEMQYEPDVYTVTSTAHIEYLCVPK